MRNGKLMKVTGTQRQSKEKHGTLSPDGGQGVLENGAIIAGILHRNRKEGYFGVFRY